MEKGGGRMAFLVADLFLGVGWWGVRGDGLMGHIFVRKKIHV